MGLAVMTSTPVFAGDGDGYEVGTKFMTENPTIWYVIMSNTEGDRTVYTTNSPNYVPYSGEVKIPEQVIANGATYTVTGIGDNTFDMCESLMKLELPPTIKYIGTWGISATGLKTLDIPASVVEIGEYAVLAKNSFMTSINVDPDNPVFASYNGMFYTKNLERLIQVPGGVDEVKLYDKTKILGRQSFAGCEKLESIDIPESVEEIEKAAFQYCSNLRSIKIPDNVTEIPSWCFGVCPNLETVILPDNLQLINVYAFEICTALKNISIPDLATTISMGAFKDCSALEEVRIGSGMEVIEGGSFENCTSIKSVSCFATTPPVMGYGVFSGLELSGVELNVLEGYGALYKAADTWKDFGKINEVEPSVDVKKVESDNALIKSCNGELSVITSNGDNAIIYNLSGIKVAEGNNIALSLPKGIYIVVIGGEKFKVILT